MNKARTQLIFDTAFGTKHLIVKMIILVDMHFNKILCPHCDKTKLRDLSYVH